MNSTSFISFIFVILLACTFGLYAQNDIVKKEFVPLVGQDGRDVRWIPTPYELVNKMLEMAEIKSNDYLIDLGSGDGRMVIAAAKLGAHALGIEYNPEMVELSKRNAKEAGVSDKTDFIQTDLFNYDLSKATVITMFLLPEINLKLRPRFLDLKPGTRIVSNTFSMDDWEPDYEDLTEENWDSWYTALMWIVPAKVEGIWKLQKGELTIHQEFQKIYGTFTSNNKTSLINSGRLYGDHITFSIDGTEYTGHVNSKTNMGGTAKKGISKKGWFAIRQ